DESIKRLSIVTKKIYKSFKENINIGDDLPKIQIPITLKEKKAFEKIWKVTKERLRKEIMKRIGWNKMEDFLVDVLRFGMDKASEDPKSFVRQVREERDPIFVDRKRKEVKKGSRKVERLKTVSKKVEEWEKAYA
ncbi:MAG: hypothetical protein AB1779_05985, partial [Candidatus Thermoplasmatota archaeon]